MKVVLASKNPHKLVEISAILQPLQVELVLESELGVDIEVEETGQTFEENSFLKAHAVMQATGLPGLGRRFRHCSGRAERGARACTPPGMETIPPWTIGGGFCCC